MTKTSNPGGHKQSKHFTLMLVPNSSEKTRSLRVPNFMFHVLMISLVGTISALTIFYLRTNYFKYQAEEINSSLQQTKTINTKLERDNSALEQEREKLGIQLQEAIQEAESSGDEIAASELDGFVEQIEYYEQKVSELEEKLEELRRAKDEIYDQLSSRDYIPQPSRNNYDATVVPTFSNSSFTSDFCSDLNERYATLEGAILIEMQSYDDLLNDFHEIRPYLTNYPTTWPVWGIVTSEVGYRQNPFGGTGGEYHSGLDIAVTTGTEVKAAGGGVVTFSGYTNGYGYLVIIDHGIGIESYYAHNSRLLASEGEQVSRGQIIAESGSSGLSTGPHVHFEIRVNGAVNNPRNYVRESI